MIPLLQHLKIFGLQFRNIKFKIKITTRIVSRLTDCYVLVLDMSHINGDHWTHNVVFWFMLAEKVDQTYKWLQMK